MNSPVHYSVECGALLQHFTVELRYQGGAVEALQSAPRLVEESSAPPPLHSPRRRISPLSPVSAAEMATQRFIAFSSTFHLLTALSALFTRSPQFYLHPQVLGTSPP